MLVSTFTKMIEKRGMHWEQQSFMLDRYIKVFGQCRCASSRINLNDLQHMHWLEAWFLLRSIQKRDAFEADYVGTLKKREEGAGKEKES